MNDKKPCATPCEVCPPPDVLEGSDEFNRGHQAAMRAEILRVQRESETLPPYVHEEES